MALAFHTIFIPDPLLDYLCCYATAFGWLENSLEGEERSAAYEVEVGYSKGAGSTVEVFVEIGPGSEFSKPITLNCMVVAMSCVYFRTGRFCDWTLCARA